jgi:hypothetical protein
MEPNSGESSSPQQQLGGEQNQRKNATTHNNKGHHRRQLAQQIPDDHSPLSRSDLFDPDDIPPVPPIPERWRAEWEMQQIRKRQGLKNPLPGETPEQADLNPPTKAMRIAAARKEARQLNEERRIKRAEMDAKALRERKEREDREKKEKLEGRKGKAKTRREEPARNDYRLPRSPALLNLSRLDGEQGGVQTTPAIPAQRSNLPASMSEQSKLPRGQVFVETGKPSGSDQGLGDMTGTYVEDMADESEVAAREAKYERRARYGKGGRN